MKIKTNFIIVFAAIIVNIVKADYEITLKDFEPIIKGDTKHLNMDKFKLKRINRNESHAFFGEGELFEEWGNDVEVVGELWKQQGYEYRPTPYKMKAYVCDLIANEKVFYPTVLEKSDFPPPGTV